MSLLRLGLNVLAVAALFVLVIMIGWRAAPSSSQEDTVAWREVARRTLVNDAWQVNVWQGWYLPALREQRADVRESLQGEWAEPEGQFVQFMVMNSANWQRLNDGFPPLTISQTDHPGRFTMAASTEGFYYGFFSPPKDAAGLPLATSLGGLGLDLMRLYQARHPSPAAVNARIELVIESWSNAAEAQAVRSAIGRMTNP